MLVNEYLEFIEKYGKEPRGGFSKNGVSINVDQMTEEQIYEKRLRAKWNHSKEKQILDYYAKYKDDEIPDSYREFVVNLRHKIEFLKEKKIVDEYVGFLVQYGKEPISNFKVDGKVLNITELTEEQQKERTISINWYKSKIKRLFDRSKFDADIPEAYKEIFEKIKRLKTVIGSKLTYERYIDFMIENGREPGLKYFDESGEEKKPNITEIKIRHSWKHSTLGEICTKYENVPIENIPEEYRDAIKKLREVTQSITSKSEQIAIKYIEYVKKYGREPRSTIVKNGKNLLKSEMTEEEIYEKKLRKRWDASEEKVLLKEYKNIPLELIPAGKREIIKQFRELGIEYKTALEEYTEFVIKHRRLPKIAIKKAGKTLVKEELSNDQKKERIIARRWRESGERIKLNDFIGVDLKDIPPEYKELVSALRKLGIEAGAGIDEIIEFVKENGFLPRKGFFKDGKRVSSKKLTAKQRKEVNLRYYWNKSKEKEMLEFYKGVKIESVPEEYREVISFFRDYGYGLDLEGKIEFKKRKLKMAKAQNDEAKEVNRKASKLESEVEKIVEPKIL